MHKILFKKGHTEYIESERLQDIYDKIKNKQFFMIGDNIRDSCDIKCVVKMEDDEVMIYNMLKEESEYVIKKVNEEIDRYYKKLTPGVVQNMIDKYKHE